MPCQRLTATELRRRYRHGERYFTDADLSGESLRGMNLTGIDLSGADLNHTDLRGTNFQQATLVATNFAEAKAGVQRRWLLPKLIGAIGMAAFASFWIGACWLLFADATLVFTEKATNAVDSDVIFGVFSLCVSALFLRLIYTRGILAGLSAGPFAFAAAFAIAGVVNGVGSGAVALAIVFAGTVAIAIAFAIVMTIAGTVAIAIAFVIAMTIAGTIAITEGSTTIARFVGTAGIFINLFVDFLIARRALFDNSRDQLVRNIAVWFGALGGTNFAGANLTDANCSKASLKNARLPQATLKRTCFHLSQNLNLARLGNTILANSQVQTLLVTRHGSGQSYVGLNLQGAYLAGADLADADFTAADLSDATLEGATLERATLTKTQALGTNFHQTILTGATLEAWNIDSTTQLDGAICEHVYLLRHHQERRPSSGSFAPGEFTQLFQEVLNTIDLIFRNGVDWKAFIQTLNQIQVEHAGEAVAVQAIENKGDGVVVVKLHAAPTAPKEAIHRRFKQRYQQALEAVEQKYKAELNAKDNEIQIYRQHNADLTSILELQAQRPINVSATSEAKAMQGNDNSRNIHVGGDFNAAGSTVNLGNISGEVSNQINQLPAPPDANQPDLKTLLTQLQAAIEAEGELSPEDKADALAELKTLAEAGRQPSAMQKVAKRSMTLLKGIAASLSNTAQLAQTLEKTWPALVSLFGL